jgi:hypothetical protein
MASPRPTSYAPRSQVMSPWRGSDPGSRGRRCRRRGLGPAAPAVVAARCHVSQARRRLARPQPIRFLFRPVDKSGYHSSLAVVTAAGAFRWADGNIGGVLNEAILYYRQTYHINGGTIGPGARNYGRSRDWGEEVAVVADVVTDACSSRARLRFASSTRIVVMCRMIEMGTM